MPCLKGVASGKAQQIFINGNMGPVWPCIPLFSRVAKHMDLYMNCSYLLMLAGENINFVLEERKYIFYQICLEGCKFVTSGK